MYVQNLGDAESLRCSACLQLLHPLNFSKNQKRKKQKRRCKDCIRGNIWSDKSSVSSFGSKNNTIFNRMQVSIDEIDEDSKNLVNGYIRESEKLINKIIADSLTFIILTYYHLWDYFELFNQNFYAHTTDPNIIKCIKDRENSTIYGNVIVSSNKNEKWIWKFKINKNTVDGIYVGISSTGSFSLLSIFHFI